MLIYDGSEVAQDTLSSEAYFVVFYCTIRDNDFVAHCCHDFEIRALTFLHVQPEVVLYLGLDPWRSSYLAYIRD